MARNCKKKDNKILAADKAVTATENPAPSEEKVKEKKLTNKEISAAIGEIIPKAKKVYEDKEVKIPKARKFKTHSQKKNFKNKTVGKK